MICLMDDGKIIEQGKHEELIHNQGKYHQLWFAETKFETIS